MKKRFFWVALFAIIATNAFADFIWDPLTIGYDNISISSEDISYEYAKGKVSFSLNQLKFTALTAGFGYMPKDKGFYFMWENAFGFGKPKFKLDGNEAFFMDFADLNKQIEEKESYDSSFGFSYASNFLFGYAFAPIENLHLSFSSGLAFGVFHGNTKFDTIFIYEPHNHYKAIYAYGVFVGLPFDISMRYFFSEHIGILCGLQDTVIFPLKMISGFGSSYERYDPDTDRYYSFSNSASVHFSKPGNKFAIKLGLTTRW